MQPDNQPKPSAMQEDAKSLMSVLLALVESASSDAEWSRAVATLHGAGQMACKLGALDIEEWRSLDERAYRARPAS